jgi:ribosomal protein S18 acetylase RimI-like enzyme
MIRLAGAPDLRAVITCVDAAFEPCVPLIGKPPAPMQSDFETLIARGSVHLLEHEGALLGLIVLEPCPDHLFVETLAVPPDRQRQGIGRRLMAFAATEAARHHLPEIRLYTHERMAASLAFYQALGFEECQRRVEDGFARVYLTRRLEPAPHERH